tara:strand:- start:5099 stop:5638 length:540 start_codon:yes stop_codon:yes gene_type:complete
MDGIEPNYKKEADKIGDVLSKYNYSLLYGGGALGLMGVAAKSANKKGVKIISVFPEYLDDPDIIFSEYQKVIRTRNIVDRKKKMIQLSDIFVCLPGGIGTLDEITEVLSSAALGEHTKPIFLINTNNFWNPFVDLLGHMERNKFIRKNGDKNIKFSSLKNLFVVNNLEELSFHKKFNTI